MDSNTKHSFLRTKITRYFSAVSLNDLLSETSGSFGDLGTLLPVLVALSQTNQISLTSSLVFGGLFNIISGFVFNIPMCVQPMKSISAIALLANMAKLEIMAAGMFVSFVTLLLTASGLLTRISRLIPISIIRGIQLGTGFSLILKGIELINKSKKWNLGGVDGYYVAIASFLLIIITWKFRYSFSALLLFTVGILLSILATNERLEILGGFEPPSVPSLTQFYAGILNAGIGQLPLTLLNSVIAVSVLADDLFPEKKRPVASIPKIAYFLSFMNLSSGWFGCVPYCCGSGGLAGQYKFGARTGLSVIILGIIKIFFGLLFGDSLTILFKNIPNSILGIMLIVAGLQLSLTIVNYDVDLSNDEKQSAFLIILIITASIIGFSNVGIGFLIGTVVYLILKVQSEAALNIENNDDNSRI